MKFSAILKNWVRGTELPAPEIPAGGSSSGEAEVDFGDEGNSYTLGQGPRNPGGTRPTAKNIASLRKRDGNASGGSEDDQH